MVLFSILSFVTMAQSSEESISYIVNVPHVLPLGTDGSGGTECVYVLFGNWPQTVKEDNVTLSTKIEKINGWNCYKGSDNFYYVKEVSNVSVGKFNNGVPIEKDKEYYFKLEPIKWRILENNYQNGKLLLSENVLVNSCFDIHCYKDGKIWEVIKREIEGITVYPNNYKYSTVRSYLNGLNGNSYSVEDFTGKGFIDKAFTSEAIEKINTVMVDNGAESTIDIGNNLNNAENYICENTEDKIFLLSEKEVTDNSYGFGNYNEYDISRIRQTTDYSRVTGAYSCRDEGYKNNCWWWLRSPVFNDCIHARHVYYKGTANNYRDIYYVYGGIVPALSISF